MFKCTLCEKVFAFNSDMLRHKKSHDGTEYPCGICSSVFTRHDNLVRHVHKKHRKYIFYICTEMQIIFENNLLEALKYGNVYNTAIRQGCASVSGNRLAADAQGIYLYFIIISLTLHIYYY